MARRSRRDRPRTDDTNWTPRDEVQWHTEQAKGAVGAAGDLMRMPRAWVTEVRAMVREMRDSDNAQSSEKEPPR